MLLPVTVKVLDPSRGLLRRMERWNEAANWMSEIAWRERIFSLARLNKRCYAEAKSRFGITGSNVALIVTPKVVSAYATKERRARKRPVQFRSQGGVPIGQHSYKRSGQILIHGVRYQIAVKAGVILDARHQANLCWTGKRFILHQPLEVQESDPITPTDWIGCDLGIVNILADSDGVVYAGNQVNSLRSRHARLRQRLQAKGTKSARRLLVRRRHRESRFARDVNHCISKKVVTKARDTLRGIAVEELGGIRERIKVRKAQRRQHHSWSFHQLRSFLEYKSRRAGVPLVAVNPKNTSRTCPGCGVIDRRNRPTRDAFRCVSCGLAGPADTIAAENIRALGRVVGFQPDAAPAKNIGVAASRKRSVTKHRSSADV